MSVPLIIRDIGIDLLRSRPDARPINDETVATLEESIARHGLMHPIRVRDRIEFFEVVAGSHRLRACDALGWSTVPCIVTPDDDVTAEMSMLAENLHRAGLTKEQRDQHIRRYAELLVARDREIQVRQTVAPEFLASAEEAKISRRQNVGDEFSTGSVAVVGYRNPPVQTPGVASRVASETGLSTRTVQRALSDKPATPKSTTKLGGIAGRYQSAETTNDDDNSDKFAAFIASVDAIEAVPIDALIEAAGRQRAVLGQRASGLADRMGAILEGLDR